MGNLEDMTKCQRKDWPKVIEEINRYHVGATDDPDHYDWHFDWAEEVKPGRGQSFSALFVDGEHFAQVMMDVYGFPTVSVCALDILHNSSDEECPCEFCTKERWDDYSDEELASEYQRALDSNQSIKLAELRAYADTRPVKIVFPASSTTETEDEMFNHRTFQQQPDGSWLPFDPVVPGPVLNLEMWLRNHRMTWLADRLAKWDERGLGK
jgi:hypothetical protein